MIRLPAEYYRAFQELIRVGTKPETQIETMTPVTIGMRKSEIVGRAVSARRCI
jgi:hypothetical protein